MIPLRTLVERKLLPFVEKPLRYTGSELNVIRKDLSAATLHGVLCFPDLYDIGMSHLGLQILYHIVNKNPRWALSRCFHPWTDAENLMRQLGIPLYSLEYFLPLAGADWIGFSLQYELQYTNVVNMLDLAAIPVFTRDRTGDHPVVIAGGPCVANPEPMAEFIDAFVIGDGEAAITGVCRVLEKRKKEQWSRSQALEELSRCDGVYVPSWYEVKRNGRFLVPETAGRVQVRATKVADLAEAHYPDKPVVPLMNVVHHRLAVEIMRGCTHGCRFCSAGTYYRPVREKSPDMVFREIEKGIAATGWRNVGLLSLSTADYSGFNSLLLDSMALKRRYKIAFSLPSTRIDCLNRDQVETLTTVSPLSSITIAPEAGSERLRRVINKEFTDEQVVSAVEALLGHRVQTIKLYFMIGLPTESREDIEAIISIVERIAGMARSVSGRCNVNVSLSPFSPKAHTAFQWEEMESGESLRAKNILIKNRLRPLKNVKVSYRDTAMTLLESVMARGDRAVASVVYHAWEMGARFDGWNDHFDFAVWTAAAQQASLDFSTYLDAIPHDQELPWSIVSTGVDTDFLLAEQARAKGQEITPDCRDGTCYLCGACSPAVTMRLSVPKDRGTIQVPVQVPDKELVPQQARKYRFVYSKGSEVRFLGHLDMVAVLVRALVASGCSLAYSQGFQPHPRVSFGPPIACGVTAKAEAFDVMTLEELSIDVAAINAMLPLGLRIVSYAPAAMTGQSITASIMAGEYDFMPLDPIDLVAVRERIEQVVDAADLYVTVIKKNTTVQKNIRPLVMALSSEELDNGVVITATLSLDPQATCKPAEFIQGLFPEKSLSDFSVCRKACFVEKQGMLKPLDQEQPVGL